MFCQRFNASSSTTTGSQFGSRWSAGKSNTPSGGSKGPGSKGSSAAFSLRSARSQGSSAAAYGGQRISGHGTDGGMYFCNIELRSYENVYQNRLCLFRDSSIVLFLTFSVLHDLFKTINRPIFRIPSSWTRLEGQQRRRSMGAYEMIYILTKFCQHLFFRNEILITTLFKRHQQFEFEFDVQFV